VKRIPVFIVVALLCLSANPARAQEVVSFSDLTISLWPEYDKPSVLVIYKGTLSPQVSLPAEVTLRIPAQAGKPFVVAVGPDPASVADVSSQLQPVGEWVQVSFIATTPSIQFEYYDPRLEKDGAQRHFAYEWPADQQVETMTIEVQHPVGASDVTLTPEAGRVVQGEDGLEYSLIDKGSVAAGDPFSLDVRYTKQSDDLTQSSLALQPSAPITPQTGGRMNLGAVWPWLLGLLGLLLIAGGGFWYWQSGRQPAGARSRRRHASQTRLEEAQAAAGDEVYCHNCGKRALPGDRFCRSCGTRLRVE
jgi:hypothetical protein